MFFTGVVCSLLELYVLYLSSMFFTGVVCSLLE